MKNKPPGLAHSPLTNRFYFVSSWNLDGSARKKHDVTAEVNAVLEHDHAELLKAVRGAREAVRNGEYEAAFAWLDSALDDHPEPEAPADAT